MLLNRNKPIFFKKDKNRSEDYSQTDKWPIETKAENNRRGNKKNL